MELFVVSTPIGNLGDITNRAIETLRFCNAVLVEDTRTSAKLFSFLGLKKPLIPYHKFNEKEVASNLKNLFEHYENIALISDAGTPAICDPGSIVVKTARDMGIKITSIIGASAVISAVSLSGLKSSDFVFLGFFPRLNKEKKQLMTKIANSGFENFVFYESPKRILETLKLFNETQIEEIRVFNDLTKKFEREYVGKLGEVFEKLESNTNVALGEYVVCFSLSKTNEIKPAVSLSLEANIIEEMFKNSLSQKAAVENLANKGLNKNSLKKAALNIKEIFNA